MDSNCLRFVFTNKNIVQKLNTLALLVYFFITNEQVSNSVYGMARKSTQPYEIYFATVNPFIGTVSTISPKSLSPIINFTGATLDSYNNDYQQLDLSNTNYHLHSIQQMK
jgi:hypothetical protein